MPLCSNGQSPIIQWQYPGKEVNRIIGADNYTVNQETGKCPVPYKFKFRSRVSPERDWSHGETTATNLYPPFTNTWIKSDDQSFGEDPKGWTSLRVRYSLYWQTFGRYNVFFELEHSLADGTRRVSRPIGFSSTLWDRVQETEFLGLESKDGLPDNCGDCVFKVTKNNVVVYQKTDPVCPTVSVICDQQCPPNTCECTSGSLVCCYDSTGRAVKSFMR